MIQDRSGPPSSSWSEPVIEDPFVGRRVGEFVIEEFIDEGGFGLVYRARQEGLGREVVIKAQYWEGDEDSIQQFLREARLGSRLDHPYAAHVYAFGAEDDGLLWIAMELVRGTTLRELLDAQGSLSLGRFVPLFEKLCEVIYTAHEQGIVHRDIKPDNVMVISRAGKLLPKLLDFGVALFSAEGGGHGRSDRGADPSAARRLRAGITYTGGGSRLTPRGPYSGSPAYMAPEQWVSASRADALTDQYALAILTYEALAGRRPFRAGTEMGLALAHASKPVPPLGANLPPALDEVLRRALAKKPRERFRDVLEFAAAFRAAAGLDRGPARIPRIDSAVRDRAIAKAPQPLADTVAFLDAARSAERALDAARMTIRVCVRLLTLLAAASIRRVAPGSGEQGRRAREALAALRDGPPMVADWLEITRALLRPFARKPDVHPIPELMLLFFGPEGDERPSTVLDELAARARPPSGDEPGPDHYEQLGELIPMLARMLGLMSFLYEYAFVVRRDGRAELWAGARRSSRPGVTIKGRADIAEGEVGLASSDGEWLLTLSPLCQLLTPAPGVPDEIFLFDGSGRHGARLVAPPIGFERQDQEVWAWFERELLDAEGEVASGAEDALERAPYLGLATFSASDAGNYVGREREVEACVNRLRIDPLLVVVGPSGAGKSSFVQAGIVPALAGEWEAVITRPGPAPLAMLAARLSRTGVDASPDRDTLWADPDALSEALRRYADAEGRGVMLVVDQFEELLTLCHDEQERRRYGEGLMRAASRADERVRVVLTMRDDFLLRAQQLDALRERLGPALQLLATPPASALERILVEPARHAGYEYEDEALVTEMVATVAGESGALALLSFTASKLWELRDRERRQLTRRAYRALGGVGGALAHHAEETLGAMPEEQQALVREAFRQLVTAEGTRAVLSRGELDEMLGSEGEEVVEALIRARLLVASEGEGGEDRIEVVHEALLSSWPRLVGWQREDAESARLRDLLRAAARQWQERGRAKGTLWHGEALLEFRVWRARYQGALTEVEEAFAHASLGEEARGRRLRQIGVIAAFVALSVGLVIVLQLEQRASRARDRAQSLAQESRQRLLALYVEQGRRALLDGELERALPYLVEARRDGAGGAALGFMIGQSVRTLADELQVLPVNPGQGAVWDVRFSPDGARIATASADGSARLWDAASGELVHTMRASAGHVRAVRFSPDGARLFLASKEGGSTWDTTTGARLWEGHRGVPAFSLERSGDGAIVATGGWDGVIELRRASDGQMLRTLSGASAPVAALAFGADDRVVVAGDMAGAARVWEVATGRLVATNDGHGGAVFGLSMSPDGTLVATASWGDVARVFELESGQTVLEVHHDQEVTSVAFSPDGGRLVTASEDGTAQIWDLATRTHQLTIADHAGVLSRVLFSADGSDVFTFAGDGSAQRWDSRTGRREWRFIGHRGGIQTAQLGPRGARLVTAGFDGTARVWRTDLAEHVLSLPVSGSELTHATSSPDGARVAAISRDGTVRVWDRGGQVVVTMQAHYAYDLKPHRIAWSPDGSTLLTSGDRAAIVWDARTGETVRELVEPGAKLLHAAYSTDGSRIVTADTAHRATLWDARTGAALRMLSGHRNRVTCAEFDPTGKHVVTASVDRTVRIWDAGTGALLHTLEGHQRTIHMVRYSADGARIISAAEDNTARIWSADGRALVTLEGHIDRLYAAALSRDGAVAATASQDGTVKLWDAATGALLWSVEVDGTPVSSIEFDHSGRYLVAAGYHTVKIWDVDRDERSPDVLERYARCRVGYVVGAQQLERIDPEWAACRRP
ncbi:protein kinase domain-containing protein [Haliangium sp.]|uniref:nSTAND1 domain-containing NTPase n=1 Tax=Haliangium sp. TaxID=2663208 RepID=UPI003D13D544